MSQDSSEDEPVVDANRRRLLRAIGAGGVIGTVGVGSAVGQPPNGNGGPPEKCECPDDTFLAKYDFEDCEFVLSEGQDVVDIHGWDNKDGEECEPVTLFYSTTGVSLEQICSFGGGDTHTDTDPDWPYRSDLENSGGQQAAISNVTFCGEFVECFQIDLVGGEVIEDFSQSPSYTSQDRLIQVIDVCADDEEPTVRGGPVTKVAEVGGNDCTFTFENFRFDPATMEATVDLTFEGGGSEPADCKGTLAGYLLPQGVEDGHSDNLDDQELRDYDTETINAGQTVTLTIDLDP